MIEMLKKDLIPSDFRIWYNNWVEDNAKGTVLDVGKSKYWDYGFMTIDNNPEVKPTFFGNIEETNFSDGSFDTVLCNGMWECVENPQKMINEVLRILKPGGKAIFGFVGEGYKPYKKPWQYYKPGSVEFQGVKEEKDFTNQYHFIICQK